MNTLLALLCIILVGVVIAVLVKLWKLQRSLPGLKAEVAEAALKEHKKRSARTRLGNTVEQLVPYMKEFPYDPSDVRILSGGPVDYVVFDGLCDGKVRELVFLDVKTGGARINPAQKQVEACAFRGQVRFDVFEVKESGASAHPQKRIDEVLEFIDDETRQRLRLPD